MKTKMLIVVFFVFFLGTSVIAYGQDNAMTVEPFNAALSAGTSFLEDEAGIAAYADVGTLNTSDLDNAENAYQTVEKKTSDYIVGTVLLDDYTEFDDGVHVYVDVSGWMVAYYLKDEKASKIIDWKNYTGGLIESTKLEVALEKVAAEIQVYLPDPTYFDFRYPKATNIMIVTDSEDVNGTTETFRIMLPHDHIVYNRTWSHAIHDLSSHWVKGNIKIDGDVLHSSPEMALWGIWEGDIAPLQLESDVFHVISLFHNPRYSSDFGISYVGVVLIYKEPESS